MKKNVKEKNVQSNDLKELFKLDFSSFSTKEKLIPLLIMVVIIVTGSTMLRPTLGKAINTWNSIKQKENKLIKYQKKITFLSELNNKEEMKDINEYFSNLEIYVPSQKPSLQTLINISKLSRMKGVMFSGMSLSPGKVKKSNKIEEIKRGSSDNSDLNNFEVDFTVTGTKENTLDFISSLEEISPLMKIDHFSTSLSRASDLKNNELIMTSNLKVYVYYRDVPVSQPKIETPIKKLTDSEIRFLKSLSDYLFLKDKFVKNEDNFNGEKIGKNNPFSNMASEIVNQ